MRGLVRSRRPSGRRGRSLLVAAFLAVLACGAVLGTGRAAACSCVGFDDAQAFARADVVFVGQVDGVDRAFPPTASDARAVWTFTVSEVFKGDAARVQGLVTSASGTSCGLELPASGEVVVFARHAAGPSEPQADWDTLHANLCDGSRELAAAPVPATFGPSRAPVDGSAGLPPLAVALSSTRGVTTLAAIGVGAAVVAAVVAVVTVRRRRRRT